VAEPVDVVTEQFEGRVELVGLQLVVLAEYGDRAVVVVELPLVVGRSRVV